MSFVAAIMDTVLEESEKKGLKSIRCIKISVGAMTGALPEYLEKYFKEASKGTILQNSALEIKTVPVEAECCDCGKVYAPERSNGYRCPECGSGQGRVIRGRDIIVDTIICD
ncbi:MAG: hydrogenase maturation nickel metallochaperone HypA [Lachnospiraceae bacterium]|nr:hydrogenase maturation nickel metallochaperone HypA [Lachnospiraceae bacterium]